MMATTRDEELKKTAIVTTPPRPVLIGISVDEDELEELLLERGSSMRVGNLVDQFDGGAPTAGAYMRTNSTGEHETVQKKAFTKWLNSHLAKKGYPLIGDLYYDLRDGAILIALLDVLCECTIKLERGRLRVHHLNNVARALTVFNERQVKLVNISPNDIVDGNAKLTLGLVWCIILHWQVNHLFGQSTRKLLIGSGTAPGQQQLPAANSGRSQIPDPPPLTRRSSSSSSSHPTSPLPSRIPISPVTPPKPTFGFRPSGSYTKSANEATPLSTPTATAATPEPALGTMSQNDLEKTLLSWCQEATKGYEAVAIKNFTTSWSDGFALNALINHFRPNLFSYGEVLAMETAEERLQHAFDLAAKHFRIEKLLDPEDLQTPRPDKKSVMMYIMCLFQVFDAPATSASTSEPTEPVPKPPPKPAADRPTDIPLAGIASASPSAPRRRPSASSSTTKTPSTKRPPPTSPQHSSHIPILSPDYQKRTAASTRKQPDAEGSSSKKHCTMEPSKEPPPSSTYDQTILNEYHADIEDILTWLLGAEEQLGTNVDADSRRFEVTISAAAATEAAADHGQPQDIEEMNRLRHRRIMATIEAAEYAKQRFETHEEFMRDLAQYFGKITATFDKGQLLIFEAKGSPSGSQTAPSKLPTPTTTSSASFDSASSSTSSTSSSVFDMESKRVIALQMQLLDDRFNRLRQKATNHQAYLHQMLIRTQNAQLEELRQLMSQTEERIAIIVPERPDEMPTSLAALETQIVQFEQLQEAMLAEQGLLNLISKFVIIDTEETNTSSSGSKDANFLDQLEALNERWANACRITETRGKFLHKLHDAWIEFSTEEGRLLDWFNRLERRLADMEESIDELEERPIRFDASRGAVKQERKFLSDIKKRLDRMQIDIFYGTEKSSKLHAAGSSAARKSPDLPEDDDDDEPPSTPLSKITQLTHTLLGQFSEQGICSSVTKSIETIRHRWDTLAGRIEHATKVTENRLEQLELALQQFPGEDEVDRAMPVAPKKPPRELPALKVEEKQQTKAETSSPTSPPPSSGQLKRRKVDFCGVVDWQSMLDTTIGWIERMENRLIELSVSGDLYEDFLQNDPSAVEQPKLVNVTSCLAYYTRLVQKRTTIQRLLEESFESSKTVDELSIQAELEQLASMEAELNRRGKDFDDLVVKGEKIIADFKIANEEYTSLEVVLESMQKRWTTLKYGLGRCQLFAQVWSSMQAMVEESASMRHVLEKYHQRFSGSQMQMQQEAEKLENLRQQIEFCSISIQGQTSKLTEFDRKLVQLRAQAPMLFFCWPEEATTSSSEAVEVPFTWVQLNHHHKTDTTKVAISCMQWQCFQLSVDLLTLHQQWWAMAEAGRYLIGRIDAVLKGEPVAPEEEEIDLEEEETVPEGRPEWTEVESTKESSTTSSSKSSRANSMPSETAGESEAEEDGSSPTEKLMIAIEALNSWLKNVIEVVEEYDEDESDDADEEETEGEGQAESLSTNRSAKVPGSKLKSLADLANAIDNRVYVLVDLQKTVDAEQGNYHFACRRAAAIIFGEEAEKDDDEDEEEETLPQIEARLKALSPTDNTAHNALIDSIQTLINRWHLVFTKFQTLLQALEEISPSTTLLEAEFAQINRWIEESVTFLNEAIAIGDLETLGEQLCECERLQEYMKGSVEKSFQNILETAREAVRILLGKSTTTFEVPPVIATIQETWTNLGERTLTKLDRLRLARELTRKLVKSLEETQAWLRQFEIDILREGSCEVNREQLALLYEEFKTDTTVDPFDWSAAISGAPQLKKLLTRRSEYLRAILEPPDCLLSQMQSFTANGQSNHALDKLKRRAKQELVRAFDSLETKLKTKVAKTEAHLENLTKLMRLIGAEQALINRFALVLADVQNRQRPTMENVEDASIALRDLEALLTESISGSRQNRLEQIQTLLAADSNLFQFLLDSTQQCIVEDQQSQLEGILTEDSRLRAQAETEVEVIEQFSRDWKTLDGRLCTLQRWLQQYQDLGSVSPDGTTLEAQREELRAIERAVNKAFSPTFRSANKCFETRLEVIGQIFNEFNRVKLEGEVDHHHPEIPVNPQPPPSNLEIQLSQMEQFLADLGLAINEMEVTFDDEDLLLGTSNTSDPEYRPEADLQLIPALLQKVIDTTCAEYEGQLKAFQQQLTASRSKYIGSPLEKRFKKLDQTHHALISSLQLRRLLVEELLELCGAINTKLIALEAECSKVFALDKSTVTETELAEMKQISNKILADVCQLKERLDIHCIRHSEILIGIEEVGARYDEIITEIAEQYVDDAEEEEEEEEVMNETIDSTKTTSQTAVTPETIRYRPSNLINPNAAAGHLSTITEEIAASSSPVDGAGLGTPEAALPTSHLSSVEKDPPIQSATLISTTTTELTTIRSAIDSTPYSLKPYIAHLQTLERRINAISASTRLTTVSKGPKLSISLVEDELHRLNKCLNEVRVPYELALCAAAVAGLITSNSAQEDAPAAKKDTPESSVDEATITTKWDTYSTEIIHSLGNLKCSFGHSWNRFLSLHRHWWLVRDATLQFNSELRKLADWFENVELQLTNGRITTVVVDDNAPYGCFTFDVDDLNYPTVARTQLLLTTQLRAHISIYAKIQVLYTRLIACFTPDEETLPSASFDDRQALLDARHRIQHEWDQVTFRWNGIIRELTWRRECLVALATGTLVANVGGYPYKRGVDADFDKVLEDFLQYERAASKNQSGAWFQLEQLQQWQADAQAKLEQMQTELTISDIDSAANLASKVRECQQELSRQFLNWMVVTQEPFTDPKTIALVMRNGGGGKAAAATPNMHTTPEERQQIDEAFQKITTSLYQMSYFTEVYATCFNYISSLTKAELEWVVSAHEHLNSVDDYLALRPMDGATGGGAGSLQELPLESLAFIQGLKDNLITHENNIEQVLTIVNELTQHATQLSLQLNLTAFMADFNRLSTLRTTLLGRLRAVGLTVWAALHHLLKQSYNRLKSYRALKESAAAAASIEAQPSSPHSATGSLRSHHRFQQQHQTTSRDSPSSASNSLHRQQATARQQLKMVVDLRAYYVAALEQFNRWLALESFIIEYYCALSLEKAEVGGAGGGQTATDKSTTTAIPPGKVLKFTIRRCEDFLTEFHFAQYVLTSIWSELSQLNTTSETPEVTSDSSRQTENEFSTDEITVHHQTATASEQTVVSRTTTSSSPSSPLEPLNYHWQETIITEIMERIRDLQREHHKRSLAHLLNQSGPMGPTTTTTHHSSTPPAVPPKPIKGPPATNHSGHNLYDTVADALDDGVPPPTPTYHRPFDGSAAQPVPAPPTSPANLDSQRQEIESWLVSMEKRFSDFVAEYNHSVLAQRRKSSLTRGKGHEGSAESSSSSLTTEASLKKQLTIISNYQSELNQYSGKLSTLSNSIDGRIASLAPKGSDISKSNISMPYYDHLIQLRKHADEMQIRINDLYLSIKCKLRSLQELFHTSTSVPGTNSAANSASSRINLMSSGLVNGAGLDLGIDFHGTTSKSSKQPALPPPPSVNGLPAPPVSSASRSTSGSGSDSLPNSGSGSTSSQATTVAAVSSYALHESSEKRFAKWLAEIEQSLQFIEKRLEAESALNENGGQQAKDTDDDPLYTNVSEMQQMHMNYFEKVKIMQREIEQKRTDHRILMELLETDSESEAGAAGAVSNQIRSSGPNSRDAKRAIDPWLARFRARVETLNTRWNSIRLRVLTLRSRLESSSMFAASSLTTTVPATPTSASLYSMNGIYGFFTGAPMDEMTSSIAATVAFNSAATERASQLLLSLRELVEWIIKRQTEFESQQLAQQQQQLQVQSISGPNVPLDVANVLAQRKSLIQLRAQLADKRPIIDSSLVACHNLLRRLAIKRSQDVAQSRLPSSTSMASSIGGSTITAGAAEGPYDLNRVQQIRAAKRQELADVEVTVSREMQRLLEIWNSLQVEVEVRLQRLDDAHLRLTDLQRAMEDLGAKLHEAEFSKSQWIPIAEIPYDQIPQQKAFLKNYSQLYVAAIARDAVHVNELAARLTGRNVPLSHANLKALEEVTTRARLLQVAVDERARELEQAVHDHGTAQQHFLTEAVDAPWERAVTANKLPCYINRTTESVQITSPLYTEIMASLSEFNRVRYAAYRTAMKLRSLQEKLGLDYVTMDILAEVFEQHGLGPHLTPPSKTEAKKSASTAPKTNGQAASVSSGEGAGAGQQAADTSATTSSNLAEDINEDLPYELRLIAVPEMVSCLKMIFEMVAATAAAEAAAAADAASTTTSSRKSKGKETTSSKLEKKDSIADSSVASSGSNAGGTSASASAAAINVPLCVDLCLNWVLALYDAPSRSGYIRQFSFQVALVLLSKISLEQKYLYLFNLIADDNGHADERRLGLLIYDCLRLPKLLGEVAAFGGTNIEPSVRSCLEMAGCTTTPHQGVTGQQVLNWIRAEPQSLVWLLVLHRLRLAEKSRHPAKCNLCRSYPIVGFRYRCLKCFNFDLCQECFLCDMATKKHKSSHPMQEYCVATTSGEDMRDFTRILRNKFKSGRYFKRHQALGYLPVQSLHEGDRLEESAPQYVHTLQGSYSHNPSSNTTPVHTLQYPVRAASPGALTQRDLDFVLDGPGPGRFQATVDRSVSISSSMYGRTGAATTSGGIRRQTSVEHHPGPYSPMMPPRSATNTLTSVFDRRLPQYHSTPVSPVNYAHRSIDNHSSDEVHARLGHYASRLAEVEFTRGTARSMSQRVHGRGGVAPGKFDSLPGAGSFSGHATPSGLPIVPHNGISGRSRTLPLHDERSNDSMNHYDLVQSPTEMLSKIAADQRSELEQIIQRLEEENKMLMTEYNQLNEDEPAKSDAKGAAKKSTESTTTQSETKPTVDKSKSSPNGSSSEFSPLYENVINSLERRQREREQQEEAAATAQASASEKPLRRSLRGSANVPNSNTNRLDSTDSLEADDDPPSLSSHLDRIPANLLEEARQLRKSKSRLESRKVDLEKCNQLLETQLTHLQTYISHSGALDPKTKKRLAQSIVELERMIDTPLSSTPGTPSKTNGTADLLLPGGQPRSRKSSITANGDGGESATPYTPSLLHTAANRVNSAVENLVEAFTEPETGSGSGDGGTSSSSPSTTNGSRFNGAK